MGRSKRVAGRGTAISTRERKKLGAKFAFATAMGNKLFFFYYCCFYYCFVAQVPLCEEV